MHITLYLWHWQCCMVCTQFQISLLFASKTSSIKTLRLDRTFQFPRKVQSALLTQSGYYNSKSHAISTMVPYSATLLALEILSDTPSVCIIREPACFISLEQQVLNWTIVMDGHFISFRKRSKSLNLLCNSCISARSLSILFLALMTRFVWSCKRQKLICVNPFCVAHLCFYTYVLRKLKHLHNLMYTFHPPAQICRPP